MCDVLCLFCRSLDLVDCLFACALAMDCGLFVFLGGYVCDCVCCWLAFLFV